MHTQSWKVTPAQYAAMEAELDAAGYAITGMSGTILVERYEVTVGISWLYDGTTLSINTSAPWPFQSRVNYELGMLVSNALAATGKRRQREPT
jgi:hypothetical protein